jgi:hypothetical protein
MRWRLGQVPAAPPSGRRVSVLFCVFAVADGILRCNLIGLWLVEEGCEWGEGGNVVDHMRNSGFRPRKNKGLGVSAACFSCHQCESLKTDGRFWPA